ncbi:MAG: hypothetical protein ABJA66_19890, partial [Actinomycetota bacterium]
IQVRDISILKKDKIYLAPLNVPFVSLDLKEFKPEFYYLDPNTPEDERNQWRAFWKEAFAGALGRAKALFLLRYGLQIVNPNQQNFLIEFDTAGQPTGTIVVRDLNDASIHREVVWALFNGPGLPPQQKDGWKALAKLAVPTLKYEFEDGRMASEGFGHQSRQETGTTGQDFGPSGTQFLWQRFSSFGNITKPAKGVGKNFTLFKNLLETMSDWGIAHDKWFISCVESHLGVNFTDIDWSKYPDSARFDQLTAVKGGEETAFKGAADAVKPKILDKSDSNNGLEITGFSFAKLSDQQKGDLDAKIQTSVYVEDFSNDECLQIHGTGFADNAVIKIGGTVIKAEYIIGKADLLVVCPKVAEINNVIKREKGLDVSNPLGAAVHYKFVFDPNYLSEMDWEEKMAKVIHDYLASGEGQNAIRASRNRRWRPLSPSFTIRLLDKENKPIAYRHILMQTAEKIWTDVTDSKGQIQIYRLAPSECKISITNINDVFIDVMEIKKWQKMIVNRGGFVALIQYSE